MYRLQVPPEYFITPFNPIPLCSCLFYLSRLAYSAYLFFYIAYFRYPIFMY